MRLPLHAGQIPVLFMTCFISIQAVKTFNFLFPSPIKNKIEQPNSDVWTSVRGDFKVSVLAVGKYSVHKST